MSKRGFKLSLCIGFAGMVLFAGNAHALTDQECSALPSNQYLAAIERGTCRIDIQTAAGPDATIANNNGGGSDRNGRNGGEHDGGGDNGGGGGRPGRR
jgi:hypothetical protein